MLTIERYIAHSKATPAARQARRHRSPTWLVMMAMLLVRVPLRQV